MNTKLPCYRAVVDLNEYDTGIFRVSLVKYPAVETNWQLFSKDTKKLDFSIQNEEKHLVTGVLLKADWPIYRKDSDGYEYDLFFDRDTVRTMAEKMLLNGFQNSLNTDHNQDSFVPGMNLQEMYFKDSESGISPKGFDDVPDGSLFATYKVHNLDVWEEIRKGTWKGFSLEMIAYVEPMEQDPEEQEIMDMLSKLNNKLNNR